MDQKVHHIDIYRHQTPWQALLAASVVSARQLADYFPVNIEEIEKVTGQYPMSVNPYYLALIRQAGDAIWRQVVPDIREITDARYHADPLFEDELSPVPGIIHRYPDRVLFMVSNRCAVYCRFCLRKRSVGAGQSVAGANRIEQGLDYLQQNEAVREVILSGGDPLMLTDDRIEAILARVHAISHIELVRIHTRMPSVLPQRITPRLTAILKRFHPLWLITHFNHPAEITPDAAHACALLSDAGIPLGCQTVLLKGVNDNPLMMKRLLLKLLQIRVKPYYLHHADPVKGTGHFRTSLQTGLKIMEALRGDISGTAIPQYVADLPGGKGKVPLIPGEHEIANNGDLRVRNYQGQWCTYPLK